MSTTREPQKPDAKEQFFRYFQMEVTALQAQMGRLSSLPVTGGERIDAMDHCLAGIARLQKEVQDASSYVPAHDQKIYSEGVKALQEIFDQTKTSLQPKTKFAFKNSIKKNDSAISLNDAAELALQQKARLFRDPKDVPSSAESSIAVTPDPVATPDETSKRPSDPLRRESLGSFLTAAGLKNASDAIIPRRGSQVRMMSFSSASSVSISSHTGVHIILPPSAGHATSSGLLTNIQDCIVDMSMPTATGKPFATLAIKNVKSSLLICGSVNGAAHLTSIEHSVIIVAARQLRMHDCRDCTIYLHANGQPIIEDCESVRFAPLPEVFAPQSEDLNSAQNQWDQVQDFKWLKAERSPNWSILSEENRLDNEQWAKIASTDLKLSLDESLAMAGVSTKS